MARSVWKNRASLFAVLLCLALTALLLSAGGAGGGEDRARPDDHAPAAPAPAPKPAPPPPPEPAPAPAPSPGPEPAPPSAPAPPAEPAPEPAPATATPESAFESRLRELIDGHRLQNSRKALTFDSRLYELAAEHSRNMQTAGKLSHDGFNDRFQRSGYRTCVENVGWGHQTPESMFEGWRTSPGHNRNLLNEQLSHVGIARAGSYVTFFACGM